LLGNVAIVGRKFSAQEIGYSSFLTSKMAADMHPNNAPPKNISTARLFSRAVLNPITNDLIKPNILASSRKTRAGKLSSRLEFIVRLYLVEEVQMKIGRT